MANITTDHLKLNDTLVTQVIQIWTWATIDTILIIIIVGGNILTLCALKISRKLSAVVSNYFISSLACSDLLVGLMLPYHLAFYITDTLGKNQFTCLLRFVMIVFACCASVYNLLAIAADRYIAIVHPLHYNRYMTKKVATCIITSGWISAVTIATIPIYWNDWAPPKTCELYNVLSKNYVMYVLTPSFSSIWLAMFIVYWRIWREARGHAKRLRNSSHHSQGCPVNDKKSVQVVFLIIGCFTICWLPYFVVIIFFSSFRNTVNAYESCFTLAMANSGINPLIYAWKNKGIRKAFIRLLQCQTPNFSDSQNFPSNRKEIKTSPDTLDGVCMVNEQYIMKSEIELQDKNDRNNYSNNNDKNLENDVNNCERKETIINVGTLVKTQLKL